MTCIHHCSARPEDLRLDLPLNQKSTICGIQVTGRSPVGAQTYVTDIVSLEDVSVIDKSKAKNQQSFVRNDADDGFKKYNPNVFRLPIPNVAPQSTVDVTITYVENLRFRHGSYSIHVPLRFPPGVLMRQLKDAVTIACNICTGTPYCQWGGCSVPMNVIASDPGAIRLVSNPQVMWPPVADFDISYSIMYV